MPSQHPHNTLTTPSQHLTTSLNTLRTPSQHPYKTITTPSQHLTTSHNISQHLTTLSQHPHNKPHNILKTPSQHPHNTLTTSHNISQHNHNTLTTSSKHPY